MVDLELNGREREPVTGSDPSYPKAGLDALVENARAAGEKNLPPVWLWNPAHCGEIDIVIRRDGVWLHEGSPIGRQPLVRLFASVLRRDPDGFHLVTPVEKMRITVEDAPFRAVRADAVPNGWLFTTNLGDTVLAGPDDPIRVETDPVTGEPAPYVHVRRGLEARIDRAVFYELANRAEERDGVFGVTSGGVFFPLGRAA